MSANIHWEPVKPGRSLPVNAPSAFIEALERATGQTGPWELTNSHREVLRGLAAGHRGEEKAFDELLEAIDTYGEIRVWTVY